MFSAFAPLLAALAFGIVRPSLAQTFTDCNPTNRTDCPPDVALAKRIEVDFSKGESDYFTLSGVDSGGDATYDEDGVSLNIYGSGDAPTLESNWYIFWGEVSVEMKAGAGTGIVSSIVFESDTLDEIDLEWVGGDTTHVQSNYYGKGNTSSYDRAVYHEIDKPQEVWHVYKTTYNSSMVAWYIDGELVRTLLYADANGGHNFPQTPMKIKLGVWAGGDPGNPKGTIQWAGGETDYDKGPFSLKIRSVNVTDATQNGTTYTYGDLTGSYESIVVGTKKITEVTEDGQVLVGTNASEEGSGKYAHGDSASSPMTAPSTAAIVMAFALFCGMW